MSMDAKRYQKIGARELSDKEIDLILPTYQRLKNQIEELRLFNNNDKKDTIENKSKSMDKINNIGILGKRGSGKTSVIKTLNNYLESQNNNLEDKKIKNYILPMIIPENMSDSMNLMATILGLFKKEVDKVAQREGNNKLECWEQKPLDIVKKYNELVKKFCYIQQEFREVSINQYTNEYDYVKKTSEIYNSDIEFLGCFNEFIYQLLNDRNAADDALIFLFIDDIDLSTRRCTDVVKTLLSYISHPRIVTILSGDLETFEEALTLDFLRQECQLTSEIIEMSFIAENSVSENSDLKMNNNTEEQKHKESESNKSLIYSKKMLTYEYLKKIIPPAYRHTVKSWSLQDRGNYIIDSYIENDNKNIKSLVQLLDSTFTDYDSGMLFKYYDDETNTEKPLPQFFHLFDSTSRGLNNVYSVLLDAEMVIKSKNGSNYEVQVFNQIKLLLETIVASKSELNENREFLLEKVIMFGSSFDTTTIRCDNFESAVYQKYNAEKRFQLFLFLDFSIRLLKKSEQLQDESYIKVRKMAVIDLINTPAISGSTKKFSKEVWNDSLSINVGKLKEELLRNQYKACVYFLEEYDFLYVITYYQFLTKSKYDFLKPVENNSGADNDSYDSDLSMGRQVLLGIYHTFLSVSKQNKLKLEEIVSLKIYERQEMFQAILSCFSMNKLANAISEIVGYKYLFHIKYDNNDIINYKIKNLYNNFLAKKFEEHSIAIASKIVSLSVKRNEYLEIKEKDYQKPIKIILAIDKNNLWLYDYSKKAETYIKNKLMAAQSAIENNYDFKVDITELVPLYKNFKKIYKGVTYTLADALENKLRNYLDDGGSKVIEIKSFDEMIEDIEKLVYSRAWYGIKEAREMLWKVKELPLKLEEKVDASENELLEEYMMWIHCYASYRNSRENLAYIYKHSEDILKFILAIGDAYVSKNEQEVKEYNNMLSKDLEEELVEHFSEIFDEKI